MFSKIKDYLKKHIPERKITLEVYSGYTRVHLWANGAYSTASFPANTPSHMLREWIRSNS